MITSIFYLLGGVFIGLVANILNILTFTIPDAFETAITQYIAYLGYAQGIIPIVATGGYSGLAGSIGLLDLFGYALSFIGVWYLFKLMIWVFSLIPWIGKHVPLPHSGGKTESHGTNQGH